MPNNPDPGELIAEAKCHADWLSDGKRDPSTARILYDLVSALEQHVARYRGLEEQSESWRELELEWQRWATELCVHPEHGQLGDEQMRRQITDTIEAADRTVQNYADRAEAAEHLRDEVQAELEKAMKVVVAARISGTWIPHGTDMALNNLDARLARIERQLGIAQGRKKIQADSGSVGAATREDAAGALSSSLASDPTQPESSLIDSDTPKGHWTAKVDEQ